MKKLYLTLNDKEQIYEEHEKCLISQDNIELNVFPGSQKEIIANEILSQYNIEQIPNLINNIVKCLSFDGILTIVDYDLDEVAFYLSNFMIDIHKANLILYSNNKKSCLSLKTVMEILEQCQMKILVMKIAENKFMITAKRQ